jgi:hypothetical protein
VVPGHFPLGGKSLVAGKDAAPDVVFQALVEIFIEGLFPPSVKLVSRQFWALLPYRASIWLYQIRKKLVLVIGSVLDYTE